MFLRFPEATNDTSTQIGTASECSFGQKCLDAFTNLFSKRLIPGWYGLVYLATGVAIGVLGMFLWGYFHPEDFKEAQQGFSSFAGGIGGALGQSQNA